MQGNQDYDQHGDGPHVGPLLEAFHAGTLRAMEAEQVARHLRACAACREQSDAIALYQLIRAAPAPTAGPELRERVYARIAAESAPDTRSRAMGQAALRERHDQPGAVVPAHARADRPSRGWLSGAVAVVIVVLLASVFWALPRLKSGAGNSSATPAPVTRACPPGSATSLPTNGYINDIAMTSASEGWAVGGIVNSHGITSRALLLRFSDCHLVPYTLALPDVALESISMGSPTEGWAIGNNESTIMPVLLHYSAGVWKQVALPKQAPAEGRFNEVRMRSADEGWIIMNGVKDSHGLLRFGLLHDANGVWSAVACPLSGISDVAPVGPNDVWITGADKTGKFAHYHNGRWTVMAYPAGAGFNSLYVVSPTDIWASGINLAKTPDVFPLVAHYDGATWQMAPQAVPPSAGAGEQILTLGDGTGWAFHTTVTHHNTAPNFWPDTPLVTGISRETGGEWQAIDWPYNDVARVSAFAPASDGDVWVVGAVGKDVIWGVAPNGSGGYSSGGGFEGHSVLLHYANGVWTRYG